ncbi:DegT/DnrJ/EryC1/StrS aminotransferase family protein [Ectothiorhodospiraceae bacterium 2226]|nr:DegT/DnrJ/EryC1/StrS aminotransferase family protein [Ectothiorhodospiraceae bacterium 2226]
MNSREVSWPVFGLEEVDAVVGVLRSGRVNYWTGEEGRRFEHAFAAFVGAPYGIALANGTVALELALIAAGVGPGDEVIVTPRSFMASVSAVVLSGARPVFVDVDRDSQNMTPDTVAAALTPRTKAILAVHLAGWPFDAPALRSLAQAHGVYLIEDCAQAHGARIAGRCVGSFGDAAAFSFCQDKIMTTGGEGGMLLLQDEEQWRRAWAYKDHGKSYAAVYEREHRAGFRWLHESFGTNWRMTEMQAAIGRVQLSKLAGWLATRKRNAMLYAERLSQVPGLRVPLPPEGVEHAWYKFYCFVRPEALRSSWSRDRILAEIRSAGIECFTGSCPEIYLEKAFEGTGQRPERRLPVAQQLGETSLMLAVDPTVTESDVNRACDGIADVMRRACR